MDLHKIFRLVLVVEMALGPWFTYAAAPANPGEKTRKVQRAVNAFFDYAVGVTSVVQTNSDFERYVLHTLTPADRAAVLERTKGFKKFPAVYRKGSALVFESGLKRMQVRFANPEKMDFDVNGVTWHLNASQPLKQQMDALEKQLSKKKTALLDRVLPEAHADGGVITGLLIGAIVGTIGGVAFTDVFTELWCKMGFQFERCINLKAKREDAMFKGSPALDAVSNQTGSTDKNNVLASFESEEWECPAQNDGKERIYRGRIRTIEMKDGKKVPISGWFNIMAKFSPNGSPTDLVITQADTDPTKMVEDNTKESATKLVAHLTFDPTTKKPVSYRIPNPDYNPNTDLLKKPYLALTPIMELTPGQKQAMSAANDTVSFVNYKIYRCVVNKVTEATNSGQDPGSPAKPKAEAAK